MSQKPGENQPKPGGPQKRNVAKPNAADGIANGMSTNVSITALSLPHFLFTMMNAIGTPMISTMRVVIPAIRKESIRLVHKYAYLISGPYKMLPKEFPAWIT